MTVFTNHFIPVEADFETNKPTQFVRRWRMSARWKHISELLDANRSYHSNAITQLMLRHQISNY